MRVVVEICRLVPTGRACLQPEADLPQVHHPRLRDVFSATAARKRAVSASSSIVSPSWKSMARLVLPKAGVEKAGGIVECSPLCKGHLDDLLVDLSGADHPVVIPDWNPSPLPFFDHI